MPHEIGFVEQGSGKLAHQHLLVAVRDFALANGWAVNRFSDSGANHELLLQAPGMSGTEEIFVGMRCYQDAGADYYNLLIGGFTGYVAGNTFDTQPGAFLSGVPAHNQRIDYWLTLNGQRLVLAMKVGTPVYMSCYLGKCLPYATPGQFPYPIVVAGMLNGAPATRFSDPAISMPFKGDRPQMRLRFLSGSWIQPLVWPWLASAMTGGGGDAQVRDTNGHYALFPATLVSAEGTLGELDGVACISGFDNAVENTLVIGGTTWLVMQDVWRTSFRDYFAMRLDP